MKVLTMLKLNPGRAIAELAPHDLPEQRKVWDLYKRGVIREMYFRTDVPGAVLMLEAADLDAARAAINELPMVAAGLLGFDVIPLGPFHGLEHLFAK